MVNQNNLLSYFETKLQSNKQAQTFSSTNDFVMDNTDLFSYFFRYFNLEFKSVVAQF